MTAPPPFGAYVRASVQCPACAERFIIDPPDSIRCPGCAWSPALVAQAVWTSLLLGWDRPDLPTEPWCSSLRLRIDEAPPTCPGCGAELSIAALRAYLDVRGPHFQCGACGRGIFVWDGTTWLLATLPGLEIVLCEAEFVVAGGLLSCVRCGAVVANLGHPDAGPPVAPHRPCPAYPHDAPGREQGFYVYGDVGYLRREPT